MKKTILVQLPENREITRSAKAALKGYWFISAMILFLVFLTAFITTWIVDSTPGIAKYFINGVIDTVLSIIGGLAWIKYMEDVANNTENPDFFGSSIKVALKRFAAATLAQWYASLIVFLKCFLLIVPGIIASCDYAMVPFIMVSRGDVAIADSLKLSRRLMYGHRWQYFCLLLRFVGWGILCIFTLGIGYFWLAPYAVTALWKFYRSLLPAEESPEAAELPVLKPYSGMSVTMSIVWFIIFVLLAAFKDRIAEMRAQRISEKIEQKIEQKLESKEVKPPHECTSWVLFPDVTGTNTTIVHKSRDSQSRDVTVQMSPDGESRKWIGMGSAKGKSLCMAFNSSGLAGVMNGGEKCTDNNTDKNAKSTPQQMYEIIRSCDTASQAVDMLKAFLAKGDYWHGDAGSIFLFADKKEGYIVELTAHFNTTHKFDSGYAVRANVWRHPGMEKYATTPYKTYSIESTREYVVRKAFNDALAKNKQVTVQDILNLSRETETPEGAINRRSVCCSWTNSASTFVIDRDYPDVLSTAYLCVGHPRHTVMLPVPICIKQLPKELTSPEFAAKSYKRLEKFKTRHPVPQAWLDFEKQSLADYNAALKQAKEMMKNNQKEQAEKLLNDAFSRIWKQVGTLPEM